jgi:hypothetical protein
VVLYGQKSRKKKMPNAFPVSFLWRHYYDLEWFAV